MVQNNKYPEDEDDTLKFDVHDDGGVVHFQIFEKGDVDRAYEKEISDFS